MSFLLVFPIAVFSSLLSRFGLKSFIISKKSLTCFMNFPLKYDCVTNWSDCVRDVSGCLIKKIQSLFNLQMMPVSNVHHGSFAKILG